MDIAFSVEITVDRTGVRSVRVLGEDWGNGAEAHGFLQSLSPLIKELDVAAKRKDPRLGTEGDTSIQ